MQCIRCDLHANTYELHTCMNRLPIEPVEYYRSGSIFSLLNSKKMLSKRERTLIGITIVVMCIPLAIVARWNQQPTLPSGAYDWNSIKVTPTKTGEKRQFFQSPTITLQELECHVTSLNPGETSHKPHQHPEEELTIVKEGTVEVLVLGEWKRVGPGSVVFQASNQLHGIKNVGTTQAVYHAIKWKALSK